MSERTLKPLSPTARAVIVRALASAIVRELVSGSKEKREGDQDREGAVPDGRTSSTAV